MGDLRYGDGNSISVTIVKQHRRLKHVITARSNAAVGWINPKGDQLVT